MGYQIELEIEQIKKIYPTLSTWQKLELCQVFNRDGNFSNYEFFEQLLVDIFNDNSIDRELLVAFDINNVKNIGKFSETMGLKLLKLIRCYQLRDVVEYVLPNSHQEYIASISDDEKQFVARTFFKKFLGDVEFIWNEKYEKPNKVAFGNVFKITLNPKLDCELAKVDIIVSSELADQIYQEIDEYSKKLSFIVHKLMWERQVEMMDASYLTYHPFNVPTLEFETTLEVVTVVKTGWDGDEYETSQNYEVVNAVKLVGSFDDVEVFRSATFKHPNMVAHLPSCQSSGWDKHYPKHLLDAWKASQQEIIKSQITMLEIETSYTKYTPKIEHNWNRGFEVLLQIDNHTKFAFRDDRYGTYEAASAFISKHSMD